MGRGDRCHRSRPGRAPLIDRQALGIDEFVLQILQGASSSWNCRLRVP